jgi:hypothetical protein
LDTYKFGVSPAKVGQMGPMPAQLAIEQSVGRRGPLEAQETSASKKRQLLAFDRTI